MEKDIENDFITVKGGIKPKAPRGVFEENKESWWWRLFDKIFKIDSKSYCPVLPCFCLPKIEECIFCKATITLSQEQIDEIFDRPPFTEKDVQFFNKKYEEIKKIAQDIDNYLCDSAEKTLAFRALQIALMHTGKAIGLKNRQI